MTKFAIFFMLDQWSLQFLIAWSIKLDKLQNKLTKNLFFLPINRWNSCFSTVDQWTLKLFCVSSTKFMIFFMRSTKFEIFDKICGFLRQINKNRNFFMQDRLIRDYQLILTKFVIFFWRWNFTVLNRRNSSYLTDGRNLQFFSAANRQYSLFFCSWWIKFGIIIKIYDFSECNLLII